MNGLDQGVAHTDISRLAPPPDGTDSPYKGDPGITSVSVKRVDKSTIDETDKRDGKAISITRMTTAADGKTIKFAVNNILQGTKMQFVATKQ